jgi:hypothetical protein
MNRNSNPFPDLKFALPISLIMWALFVLGLLLVFNSEARADETDPSAPTPKLELAFDVAELADMMTTLDIKNHPGYIEENPILGQHPSQSRIIGMCVGAAAIHYLVTRELVREHVPASVVNFWEIASASVEVGFAAHNYSIGLRFKL